MTSSVSRPPIEYCLHTHPLITYIGSLRQNYSCDISRLFLRITEITIIMVTVPINTMRVVTASRATTKTAMLLQQRNEHMNCITHYYYSVHDSSVQSTLVVNNIVLFNVHLWQVATCDSSNTKYMHVCRKQYERCHNYTSIRGNVCIQGTITIIYPVLA